MKRIYIVFLTALLVFMPVNSNSCLNFNHPSITYAAKTKKKATTEKKNVTKKKKPSSEKSYNGSTYKNNSLGTSNKKSSGTSSGNPAKCYIPRSGKKYHRNPSCSNMKNPSETTIQHAEEMGYEACKKCY